MISSAGDARGRRAARDTAAGSGDLPGRVFVALALTLPLAFLGVHVSLGHDGDIAFFHAWYLAFRAGADFYEAGPGINYPIVGALLVCGPARAVELAWGAPLSLDAFRGVLKVTLALAEVGLLFASRALLLGFRAPRPNLSALSLWVLPSTWAAGAYFGQIDVWGSLFLVASIAALARYREQHELGALALSLASLHAAILLKPLTLFSVPALLLLLALALRSAPRAHSALALASCGCWFAPDLFLTLPDGYLSHLSFALFGRGLSHGSVAVTNGASLWALVAAGDTPADAVRFLGVSSLIWGALLFALAVTLAAYGTWRAGFTSAALLRLAGLCQLAMATLLTGVHERYLVHAAALLFLSACVDRVRGVRLVWMLVTLTTWGVYVLSSLHYDAFVGPLGRLASPQPAAILALLWLAAELFVGATAPSASR